MSDWRGAAALLKYELRRSWLGLIITVLFFLYVAAVMSPLFEQILKPDNELHGLRWMGNFMYLSILPNMGFIMNKSVMLYWQKDAFTRKIAFWRTLPIGLNSIVLARVLQLLIVLPVIGTVFFGLQYTFLSEFRGLLTVGQYIAFSLIWIGYALTMSAVYMFFEQTVNGKRYFVACLCYIAVYAAVGVMLYLARFDLLAAAIRAVQTGNMLPTVLMPLVGLIMTTVSGVIIRKRLTTRNLLN